ncbi:MAG: D-alanine--D-alanine ligase family protein [Vulcanimicrobiota bacterium]
MSKKLNVAVVFGGRSGEHEVSVMSARAVMENLDREKYNVMPLYVSRDGQWLPPSRAQSQLSGGDVKQLQTSGFELSESLALVPGVADKPGSWQSQKETLESIDVVFPVIHGTYGEDGTLQGMLEMAYIPYVGAGVLASALGMDKSLMKAVCRDGGIPVLPAFTLTRTHWEQTRQSNREELLSEIEKVAGYPTFVKPCNLGSSVGISKARDREELRKGIETACRFDRKILIEKGLESPREIELAVLGNDLPQVSLPGEIIHGGDFYDYETKYFQTEGQKIQIPAQLSEAQIERLKKLAIQTFQVLDLNGLSRVDFLMDRQDGDLIYLNEVNTMPGFTPISMYSMMWKASGKEYRQLLDELIELGLEKHRDRTRNETSVA